MLRFSVAFLLWLALALTPSTSRVIEPLSWSPRAFVYRSFLSSAECAALREAAEPRLAHAAAEGAADEGTAGVFFERAEFPLLQAVEARAAYFWAASGASAAADRMAEVRRGAAAARTTADRAAAATSEAEGRAAIIEGRRARYFPPGALGAATTRRCAPCPSAT